MFYKHLYCVVLFVLYLYANQTNSEIFIRELSSLVWGLCIGVEEQRIYKKECRTSLVGSEPRLKVWVISLLLEKLNYGVCLLKAGKHSQAKGTIAIVKYKLSKIADCVKYINHK